MPVEAVAQDAIEAARDSRLLTVDFIKHREDSATFKALRESQEADEREAREAEERQARRRREQREAEDRRGIDIEV